MVKKRYIIIPLAFLMIGVLVIGVIGYILYSTKVRTADVVFAPTEVGTSAGDRVIKDIGLAGGTLTSPDGRLTITVPKNALAETLPIAIQPITNKLGGGLGLAYRLEPSGKIFTTPLQISVRYDDQDLEGTVPEALSLAYQDQKGAWHAQMAAKLDPPAKTLTVAATHFSDWSFISRLKLSPSNAVLHVGESQVISLVFCKEPGRIDKLLNRPAQCSAIAPGDDYSWKVVGEGTIAAAGNSLIYTAPGKRPTPNIAKVVFSTELDDWDEPGGKLKLSLAATITIVGAGYKVEPGDGPAKYSGIVCSLEAPFTISVSEGQVANIPITFRPSSALAGTANYMDNKGAIMLGGSGPYTIQNSDTKRPDIAWNLAMNMKAGPASHSDSGVTHIYLTELETDECK